MSAFTIENLANAMFDAETWPKKILMSAETLSFLVFLARKPQPRQEEVQHFQGVEIEINPSMAFKEYTFG
jgi:hypothetical protein